VKHTLVLGIEVGNSARGNLLLNSIAD